MAYWDLWSGKPDLKPGHQGTGEYGHPRHAIPDSMLTAQAAAGHVAAYDCHGVTAIFFCPFKNMRGYRIPTTPIIMGPTTPNDP